MNNDVIKVQLSCGVDYYKGEKGDKPVKGVDYFTQEDIADIVEQIETGGVDLDGYATKEYVDNAVSGVVVSETDPTVPAWAKQANKPTYTANEVGALPADTVLFSGSYNDLTDKPTIPTVPSNVSAFTNDAGYLTDVEFHDTMNKTTVSVNDVGLYVETLDNEQNPVYRTDVINMGVSVNGPSGGVAMGEGKLIFAEPTNGNMLEVTIDENADSLYVNGDKVALVNDIPAPIVIQSAIAGQPTPNDAGGYTLPLTITSNNMAEAYAQYQTHPSTVGISVDLSAMGTPTKMYMDCESFYRNDDGNGGYTYETYGEFNDNSLSQSFGYEFMNINVHLNTGGSGSSGTITGVATVHQLASKANSADLATVATSGDYNDLTNKPTIPTAYTLPTASTSTLGGVKVDGTTITISDGVISATSSGGSSYTFINGLTENNGTVSWDLYSRIHSGLGINSLRLNTANNADGDQSLAEGFHTSANGAYSHAEGNYTQASGSSQHAEGKFNVEDSNSILQNIAGNGSSASTRSTMFARDWNGNEYLSGNLFVGCNDFTTTANGLTTANAGGSRVATMSDLTADNITYYWIEGEDPETGDPIRSETADTLTATLDSVLSDMETAISNAGGGSSYTAGNGIEIDSNGVISQKNDAPVPLFALLAYILTGTETGMYNQNATINFMVNNNSAGWVQLNKTNTDAHIANIKNYGMTISVDGTTTNLMSALVSAVGGDPAENMMTLSMEPYNGQYTLSGGQMDVSPTDYMTFGMNNDPTLIVYIPASNKWYIVKKPWRLFQNHYFISKNGLTSHSIAGAIDEVASNLNTRIPSAPTTDGNYVLKVSVSSGTPTYSWVAE